MRCEEGEEEEEEEEEGKKEGIHIYIQERVEIERRRVGGEEAVVNKQTSVKKCNNSADAEDKKRARGGGWETSGTEYKRKWEGAARRSTAEDGGTG